MRVIAGKKKGLKLVAFDNCVIRPTSDRTKELIFNVLRGDVSGAHILDVFAGTGSLGIEALSRGAVKAIFIENNRIAQRILQRNLEKTGFSDRSELVRVAVRPGLRRLHKERLKFDVILADPPYNGNLAVETLALVRRFELLAEHGWLVIEHSIRKAHLDPDGHYVLRSWKKQGESVVSFFQYE